MAEPSHSGGCIPLIFMVVAALFSGFVAAFRMSASTSLSSIEPTQLVDYVSIAPVDSFTTDELHHAEIVIRKRLNSLGLSKATVTTVNNKSILVGMPHIEDLYGVVETLSARGLLEFVDFSDVLGIGMWEGHDILTTGQGDHPISDNAEKNPVTHKPFVTVMTTSDVQSAAAILMNDQWGIRIEFSDEGAEKIRAFSRSHIGKPLAIVVDGKVLSTPTIQAELSTGASIQGNFTEESARQLAVQIGGGALPFEVWAEILQSDFGISVGVGTPTMISQN